MGHPTQNARSSGWGFHRASRLRLPSCAVTWTNRNQSILEKKIDQVQRKSLVLEMQWQRLDVPDRWMISRPGGG